jgi:SAM-dependent methyltransferase
MLCLLEVFSRRPDLQQVFPQVLSEDWNNLLRWALGVVQRKWEDSDYATLKPFHEELEFLAQLKKVVDPALSEWRYRLKSVVYDMLCRSAVHLPFMICYVDLPRPDEVYSGIVPIQGWVISRAKPLLIGVRVDEKEVATLPVDSARPDVERAHPDQQNALHSGFSGVTYSNFFQDGAHLISLRLLHQNKAATKLAHYKIYLETSVDRLTIPEERIPSLQIRRTSEQRRERLQKIIKFLQCPSCQSDQLGFFSSYFKCRMCNRRYEVVDNVPVFHSKPFQNIEPTGAVSTNPYPKHVIDCIEEGSGLGLDYGAGGRPYAYDNIVQVEIFRYGFTDVVVDKEEVRLPFKDNTFSAVFSLAVLEHVRDPWSYVSEIRRVLQPGGKAFIESAFLQPVHAYPNHYFNTTLVGLKELCKRFDIVKAGVRPYQEPWVALVWELEAYRDRLGEEQRKAFINMKVDELTQYLSRLKTDAEDPIGLKKIPAGTVDHIAAGVYVELRKTA